MSDAQVTILGSNSAIAVADRYPSGQVVKMNNDYILIDCGEGTQFRMDQYNIKRSKINTILITHLHGDHLFGLPGLLTSYQLGGRKAPLTIYSPAPLREYLDISLGGTGHFINYPLEIIELDFQPIKENKLHKICELPSCVISAFELEHRIPCAGYHIQEKPKKLNINKSFIEEHQPTVEQIKGIINGDDFTTKSGDVIKNKDCTSTKSPSRSYAYCSDTIYLPELSEILAGTSTIYHESTYLHNLVDKAAERFHTTAKQAAEFARNANAEQLILGHYSSRYRDISVFADEARPIFENVELAVEGKTISI